MDPATLRKQRVAEWIERHIGARTHTEFAADITEATNWPIDYSRLGRYKNQKLQVGPSVVKHFNDYATKRNLSPVDLTERIPQLSLEERAVRAAEKQADATRALADELQKWRTEDRVELASLRRATERLTARLLNGPGGEGSRAPRAPRRKAG